MSRKLIMATLALTIAVTSTIFLWRSTKTTPKEIVREPTVLPIVEPVGARLVTTEKFKQYVGAETCKACHKDIYKKQTSSNHAASLRPMERKYLPSNFLPGPYKEKGFEESGRNPPVRIYYYEKGGKFYCDVIDPTFKKTINIDFILGSGQHGISFTSFLPEPDAEKLIEFRHSYLTPENRWDYTPGHRQIAPSLMPGQVLNEVAGIQCLLCHSTVGTYVQDHVSVPQSFMGVTCEACHGPGQNHIKAVSSEQSDRQIDHPGSWEARRINNLCGRCHGTEEVARIGDKSFDATADSGGRHAPFDLMRSACFQKSPMGISCITCHDPHTNVNTDERHYVQQCLKCHSEPKAQQTCPVNPKDKCIGCHMPPGTVGDFQMVFTDHWIRTPSPGKPPVE